MSDASKKKEFLDEIHSDEGFQKIVEALSPEDRKRLEGSVESFVGQFCVPLVDQLQQALNDPKIISELKKRLAR